MANVKITGLPVLVGQLAGDDEIEIVNTSGASSESATIYQVTGGAGVPHIILQDQKTANTAGGGFTAGNQTRVLNTEMRDINGDSSLAANQFTLTAGEYYIEATAPAYSVNRHKVFLFNVSDATNLVIGKSSFSSSGDISNDQASLCGTFTVGASKALELRHFGQNTKATDGFGIETNNGMIEIYAQVKLWRTA